MTPREAILSGTAAASDVHQSLGIRARADDGLRAIDVFGTIDGLGLPLSFSELDGLLGACVRIEDVTAGILITTKRDLHMQRFTGAHELGHFVLEHEGSLDREIRYPGNTTGRDIREIEADAFAAEFLMPKWLISAVAKRRGWWSKQHLVTPEVVYQLALRLAISYEATCWGLASQKCIDRASAEKLAGVAPKESKLRVLGRRLEDPRADVWHLTPGDDGAYVEAGPNDRIVLQLPERGAAGYLWQTDLAAGNGFVTIDDSSELNEKVIGAPSTRRLVLRVPPPGRHVLSLVHRRPFDASAKATNTFSIEISTNGSRGTEPDPKPRSLEPSLR